MLLGLGEMPIVNGEASPYYPSLDELKNSQAHREIFRDAAVFHIVGKKYFGF